MAPYDKLTQIQIDALSGGFSSKERVNVATRCRIYSWTPNVASTPNLNSTVITFRSRHVITCDCTDIQLEYGNTDTWGKPGFNPVTVECVIEKVTGVGAGAGVGASTFYPLTYGGAPSKTVHPGSTIRTDVSPVELSKGDVIFIRTLVTVASLSDRIPGGLSVFPFSAGGGEGAVPGNCLTDNTIWYNWLTIPVWKASSVTAVGAYLQANPYNHYYYRATVAGTTGATLPTMPAVAGETFTDGTVTWKAYHIAEGVYGYTPRSITGRTYKPEVSATIAGDSIAMGAGDKNPANNNMGDNFGFLVRALESASIGYIGMGHSGNRTDHFMGDQRLYSTHLIEDTTHFIGQFGINNVNQPHSVDVIKSQIIDIAKMARGRGQKVYWTTLAPLSTSTDGWTTVANQTAKYKDVRNIINRWLLSRADGYIDGCIDSGSTVEEGFESGIWKVGTVLTTDNLGIHPNEVGHALMTQPVLKEVSTWTV